MKRIMCIAGATLLLVTGLLTLLGPRLLPREIACGRKNSRIAQAKCKEYHDAARLWAKVRGGLPVRLDDMQVPLQPGEPEFLYVADDPWGHPYVLERSGDQVRVRCAGPDGKAGTEDDIVCPE
ncbi:MAG: type II secretion system protein GspG [Planctomycetes bacterium]|nr:type II secretion system protein GspG [Planctomycetota bacterium]